MLVKKTASCLQMLEWCEGNNLIVTNPQPGDLVFYKFKTNNRRTNHIGLVTIANSPTSFQDEEGNTSINSDDNGGSVMLRNRTNQNVVAYARPKYTGDQCRKILAIANGELGVKESPPNSNNVKYNTWFYGHPVSGKDYPWCCTFISWLFNQLEGGSQLPYPTLKMGSKGPDVKNLQTILNSKGYSLVVDGEFGPSTQAAVKNFQRANGLTDDGIVGPKTWEKLTK